MRPIDEQSVDFDSSGVLVKRKIKKRRIMQTQNLPGQQQIS
jgi:hypothetical protein